MAAVRKYKKCTKATTDFNRSWSAAGLKSLGFQT